MAASGRRQASLATAVHSTWLVSTRRLPQSERPGGGSDDVAGEIPRGITASLHQHLRRSTAYLRTLHEPWVVCGPGADHLRTRTRAEAKSSDGHLTRTDVTVRR